MSTADIAAIVVAIAAVLFAAWQGMQQRTHNRLSVRPHQVLRSTRASLYIANNGLGPAILASFTVWIGEEEGVYAGAAMQEEMKRLINNVIAPEPSNPRFPVLFTSLAQGTAIRVGEEITVMRLAEDAKTKEREEILNEAVKGLAFRLKYRSFYGDRYELTRPAGLGLFGPPEELA